MLTFGRTPLDFVHDNPEGRDAMSRRIRTTVLGIVALVAIGGIGITAGAFLSGGSSPAQTAAAPVIPSPSSLGSTSSTTSPTSDPTYDPVTPSNPMIIPDPATHALDRSEKAQPFGDNLTYSVPLTWSSRNWDGAVDYADMTNCMDTASCPHITFIDLTNPSSVSQYGTGNPVATWAGQSTCAVDSEQELLGPVVSLIDDQRVLYYRQGCGKDPYSNFNAAWYFPDQHLLVVGVSGPGASLAPEVVQAVLKSATWR